MDDVDIRWHDVPEAASLWEGDILGVDLDGESVLVVHHLDGTYSAYQGFCPHQAIQLAQGEWDEEKDLLLCGGHRWEFDVKAGVGINPPCSLYRYPVEVGEDVVRIGIPQDGKPHYKTHVETPSESE